MNNDNPDTVSMQENTRWVDTVAEDVFQAGVKVQLRWSDIEAAVERGAILPQHAHALWAGWAMPGSPTRIEHADGVHRQASPATLSDPPYLEKLRQSRGQPLHGPVADRPRRWLSHLAAACFGALLMFLGLALM
ncbi:MAG: hypothetical protein EP306_06310 [Burkholderiales bacterium]|nr:MAG: hypothetical protein EP306_06310 [Burkholderiales bacterium]